MTVATRTPVASCLPPVLAAVDNVVITKQVGECSAPLTAP